MKYIDILPMNKFRGFLGNSGSAWKLRSYKVFLNRPMSQPPIYSMRHFCPYRGLYRISGISIPLSLRAVHQVHVCICCMFYLTDRISVFLLHDSLAFVLHIPKSAQSYRNPNQKSSCPIVSALPWYLSLLCRLMKIPRRFCGRACSGSLFSDWLSFYES